MNRLRVLTVVGHIQMQAERARHDGNYQKADLLQGCAATMMAVMHATQSVYWDELVNAGHAQLTVLELSLLELLADYIKEPA